MCVLACWEKQGTLLQGVTLFYPILKCHWFLKVRDLKIQPSGVFPTKSIVVGAQRCSVKPGEMSRESDEHGLWTQLQ